MDHIEERRFDRVKQLHDEVLQKLDAPGDVFSVTLVQDFLNASHRRAHLTVYLIDEVLRIFAGEDELACKRRFSQSWVGQSCRVFYRHSEGFGDLLSDITCFAIDCTVAVESDSRLPNGRVMLREFVCDVRTLYQAVLLFAAAVHVEQHYPDGFPPMRLNSDPAVAYGNYQTAKEFMSHARFPLAHEIGQAVMFFLRNVPECMAREMVRANSLTAQLNNNWADIAPHSPEGHVMSFLRRHTLREFLFQHAPLSHEFVWRLDSASSTGSNLELICEAAVECRPHLADAEPDARAAWEHVMEGALEALWSQAGFDPARAGARILEWYSAYDLSRGWGNHHTDDARVFSPNKHEPCVMPDPILFFLHRLLQASLRVAPENSQRCRFGVAHCARSAELECEHESRLRRFVLWLAGLRYPCDLGALSVRMWNALQAAVQRRRTRAYGLDLSNSDFGWRTADWLFWPFFVLQQLSCAEQFADRVLRANLYRAARAEDAASGPQYMQHHGISRDTDVWQAGFRHARARLQPFFVDLICACSSTFTEQCIASLHVNFLLPALRAFDCHNLARPLFERLWPQIANRVLRRFPHHTLVAMLWRMALTGGHTWLCSLLFRTGFPACAEEHTKPAPLTKVVVRRRATSRPSVHERAQTLADHASAELCEAVRARSGLEDSEPFWMGPRALSGANARRLRARGFAALPDVAENMQRSAYKGPWKHAAQQQTRVFRAARPGDLSRSCLQEYELLRCAAVSWFEEAARRVGSASCGTPSLQELCSKAVFRLGLVDLTSGYAPDESTLLVRDPGGTRRIPALLLSQDPLPGFTDAEADERGAGLDRIERIAEHLERQASVSLYDREREQFDFVYVGDASYEPPCTIEYGNLFYAPFVSEHGDFFRDRLAIHPDRRFDTDSPTFAAALLRSAHAGCLLDRERGPPIVDRATQEGTELLLPLGKDGAHVRVAFSDSSMVVYDLTPMPLLQQPRGTVTVSIAGGSSALGE